MKITIKKKKITIKKPKIVISKKTIKGGRMKRDVMKGKMMKNNIA